MPALDKTVIKEISTRLERYLERRDGWGSPIFLKAGGSAGVFRVDTPDGVRAIKVFDPIFLEGSSGAAERRRLQVQSRLIDHSCPSLIQTFRVEEAEGTAFVEMEFIEWPELTGQLAIVPDAAVVTLITQLVQAVRYLEEWGIVHRDIKPENIHVSPDFKRLKLLDLGVARDISTSETDDAAITDHGNKRLFLATAQYSPPEYLFRLDEPSTKLWKGINIYQVGAVLHDLIMKQPLFASEMRLGNRWLVARAVLTKIPEFTDGAPNRLSALKALSSRCLVKDLDLRLQLVGWDDFVLEHAKDPLTALSARLSRGVGISGEQARASAQSRLDFDRSQFCSRFMEQIRNQLIATCGPKLPLTLRALGGRYLLVFGIRSEIKIVCHVQIEWQMELYGRTAKVSVGSYLHCLVGDPRTESETIIVVTMATIQEAEDEAINNVLRAISSLVNCGLNMIDSHPDIVKLHGLDLCAEGEKGDY